MARWALVPRPGRTRRHTTWNALVLEGWRVLRFSWEDVVDHPDEVVAAVRAALGLS